MEASFCLWAVLLWILLVSAPAASTFCVPVVAFFVCWEVSGLRSCTGEVESRALS